MKIKNKEYHFDPDTVPTDKVIETALEIWYKPFSKTLMEVDDRIKTVVVAISSFWNDEADDACHTEFICLSDEYSSWDDCFSSKKNTILSGDNSGDYYSKYAPGIRDTYKKAEKKLYHSEYGAPYPNNSENYIAAIGPYCKDGCTQGMNTIEAFSPLYIISKNDDGSIKSRFVGDMVRLLK